MIRVYLVDDHEVVRRGLRDVLAREGDIRVVGGCGSAVEAEHDIPAVHPDVMVVDARLPDGSGVEVCREVRSVDPTISALILTALEDDEALLTAIVAGAAGYVLKQIRGSDLVMAVRRVAAGQSLIDSAVTARLRERVMTGEDEASGLPSLTDEERDVLVLIAEGLTDRQITQRTGLRASAVSDAVSRLLTKLGLDGPSRSSEVAATLLKER